MKKLILILGIAFTFLLVGCKPAKTEKMKRIKLYGINADRTKDDSFLFDKKTYTIWYDTGGTFEEVGEVRIINIHISTTPYYTVKASKEVFNYAESTNYRFGIYL